MSAIVRAREQQALEMSTSLTTHKPNTLAEAREALTRVFGFQAFRPGQPEILEAVFNGEDVLAVMPTGSGKSLCYQLPAICRPGLTIVISPLIALIDRKSTRLNSSHVSESRMPSFA